MLLGVPVFVVIYTAINNLITRKLKNDNLPCEVEDYHELDYIDPISRQAVKKLKDDEAEEAK